VTPQRQGRRQTFESLGGCSPASSAKELPTRLGAKSR